MEMNFKLKWECFINSFDSAEERKTWNTDEYGEMEAYCENLLYATLVRFIFADGIIKNSEVDKLNSMFGFGFSLTEVEEIYNMISAEKNDIIDDIENTLMIIERADTNLCNEFKKMLVDACQIIIDSDDLLKETEVMAIKTFVLKINQVN